MPGPAIWIDAARRERPQRVFGMELLERILRGVLEAGLEPDRVVVSLSPEAPAPRLRPDLERALAPELVREAGAAGERLAAARAAAPGLAFLVLADDTIVDPRVLAHLAGAGGSTAFLAGDEGGGAAVVHLAPDASGPEPSARSVREIAERGIAGGDVKPFAEADFDAYVQKLRREVAPYAFRVSDPAAARRVERFLFWSNYKGSTDFMTRYVYPPLVWALVRPLARMRVHPNWVTAVNWVATFGCIPLFAAGQWLPGLALAYLMSVMDSVDGKLARLTYTSSKVGDVADHGLDIVHPPFWYMAWAWALGGGVATSLPWRVSLWMLGFYAADRVVTAVFRQMTGTSVHGVTPLDVRMRTFISRRNVNLAAFTLALAVDSVLGTSGIALGVFYAIVAWQVLSLGWHLQRLVAFWGVKLR